MKEIGGYFGLESLADNELYVDLIAVNSARNALAYLIRARKIKKLYIPYYLCDSVSGVCEREGCRYEYYNIGENFLPIFEKELADGEFLYIVNYFGQIAPEVISLLKSKHRNVICDNVQAFFEEPIDGIDTVYSCRKFFGVADGGYVSTDAVMDGRLELDISMDRMKHVLGRYEGKSASDYYGDFRKNDDAFADMPLREMSKLTRNIMGAVDYISTRETREKNFALLHSFLGEKNKLQLTLPKGPYVYPFYHENGMEIKKSLAEKKIFVATLWPEVIEMGQKLEADLAMNILPLPCDQRYDEEDMKRIVATIMQFIQQIKTDKSED